MTACANSKPIHCPSSRHCKAMLYKPTTHNTEGNTKGSSHQGRKVCCQRRGATSSQATAHTRHTLAEAVAKPKVVHTVVALSSTCDQASGVHSVGQSFGKGQTPETLPTAKAHHTAKYAAPMASASPDSRPRTGPACTGSVERGLTHGMALGSRKAGTVLNASAATTAVSPNAAAAPCACIATSASPSHCHAKTANVGGDAGPMMSAMSTTVRPYASTASKGQRKRVASCGQTTWAKA